MSTSDTTPDKEQVKNNKWKWISISLMVIACIPLSFNLPIFPFSLAFFLFFLGHGSMAYLMYVQKEHSLFLVNIFWCIIDVVGIVRWM